MSWQRVTDAYKKKFNKSFIACQFTYERDFIINTIKKEFPHYETDIITAAVMHTCRIIDVPRSGELFFQTIARILKQHR